jgi:hypothetical protein
MSFARNLNRWRIVAYDAVEPLVEELGGWGARLLLYLSSAGQVAIGTFLGLLVLFLAHQVRRSPTRPHRAPPQQRSTHLCRPPSGSARTRCARSTRRGVG